MSHRYYTPVDNKLLEFLMKINKASQLKILLCITRFTAGFHRPEASLSCSFIAKHTGLSRRSVFRELAELERMGIVVRKSSREYAPKILSLNSDIYGEAVIVPGDTAFIGEADASVITRGDGTDTQEINILYKNIIPNKESKETPTAKYSKELTNAIDDWVEIRGLDSKSTGALYRIVDKYIDDFGEVAVCEVINQCIAEGRSSIYFDRLKTKEKSRCNIEDLTWQELG